jgi:PKD repeat protein
MKSTLIKVSFLGVFLLSWLGASAQTNSTNWVDMMQDPTVNFYDVQSAFYAYWEGKTIEKGKGYKQFKRWEAYMAPRVYPSGNLTLPSKSYEKLKEWEASNPPAPMNKAAAGLWTALGPIGAPSSGGAGRLNFVRFDPTNSNIIYVGAPDGGLWTSTNGGTSWSTNTDQLTVIGCSDIAINPSNTSIMYLATGDGDGGDSYSIGVLKSTDGGATWNTTGLTWATSQGRLIRRLIINPSNPSVLLAATSNGMYRTADAGVTWTQVQATIGYYDVEFKPGDPNTVYAVGTRLYRSTNNGVNWTQITSGIPAASVQRMSLAVTAANSAYVYILAGRSTDQGLLGIYRSTDSGLNFTTMKGPTGPNLLGWNSNGGDAGGQAFYDLTIAASPTVANTVVVGGVNVWRSTDGGANWTINAHWTGSGAPYVHSDHHDIQFLPGSGTTYFSACDGGLAKTTNNGGAWTDISANLNIAQQYRLSLSTTNAGLLIAGHQDNGVNKLNAGSWSEIKGGDGMDCFIDRTNNNIMYGAYVYGDYARSTNGGASWTTINTGIPNGAGNADWLSVWHQDPVTATMLYAGGRSSLYRSTNSGTNWSALGTPSGTGNIIEFAIAPSNNQIIYAVKQNAISKSSNGGTSWTNVTGTIPTSSAFTNVAVHTSDANIVWMTISGYNASNKVFKSTDGGANWTNISTGLPNVPCNTIVFQDGAANDPVYLGTDIGVYYRDNSAGTWVSFFDGLPRTSVSDLEIYYPTGKIRAATFGRGTWESDLLTPGSFAPVADFTGPQSVCLGASGVYTDASAFTPTSWSWVVTPGTEGIEWSYIGGTSSTAQNPEIQFNTVGSYTIELTATNAMGSNTATKTNYVTVLGGVAVSLPISEGFTGTFLPANWSIVNLNGLATWTKTTDAGFAPTVAESMMFDNYNIDDSGDNDEVHLPKADFSNLVSAQLEFDVAYAPYNGTYFDGLEVAVSTDCGGTFTTIYAKSNLVLATAPAIAGLYTPTAGEWRTETLDLSSYVGEAGLIVAFRNIAGYGNRLFIDNVNLTGVLGATPPVASFTGTPTTLCEGESVTYTNTSTGSPTSYAWVFNGGTPATSTATNPTVVYNTAGSHTVELTATNGAGSNTSTLTNYITVNALPATPTISAGGPTTFCDGGSVTLTSSSATDNVWSTGETTQSIVVTASGNYDVYLDNGTCSSATSTATTVTVNALPSTPTISAGGPTTFCDGGSVTLTSSSATDNVWSTGETTQSIVVTASGNYDVYVDNGTCSSATSTAITVTVNALPATPTISAGGPTTFCDGGNVTLTSSSATDNVWSTGETTQSIVVTASGNYDVYIDNGTCSSSTSGVTIVTVNASPATPTIIAGGPTTFCTGGSVTLTSSSVSGNVWSTGETTQSIVVTASGNYDVYVDNGTCSSATSTATTVTVNALPATPTISAGGPTTFCDGGSVTLTSSSTTNNIWSTGETTQSIVVTASGNYDVYVDNGTCSSATSGVTIVTVNASPATPTITAGGPTTFCTGGSVTLTSSSVSGNVWSTGEMTQSIVVTASGNYDVYVDNGTCSSATSASTTVAVGSSLATPTITSGSSTTFCSGGNVTLTSSSTTDNIWSTGETTQSITVNVSGNYDVYVDNGTCSSATSTATTVTVNALPATPTISAGGPTTFCDEGSVTLTSSSATDNVWSTGETTQSIVVTASGNYDVYVDNGTCSSATSGVTIVTVNASPATPTITAGGPTTFCTGGSVTLTSSSVSGNVWSTGEMTQSIVVTASGNYDVYVDNGTCSSATSASTTVAVGSSLATPTITSGSSTTFCSDGNVTLTSSSTTDNIWSTGETTQSITVNVSGNYDVYVDNGTCSSATSTATTVTVNALPATPAITASGPTTFCDGGSVTLTSSSATDNIWSTGETTQSIVVTASGNYDVFVDNGTCSSAISTATTVTVNALPATPTISAGGPTTFCDGGSVTLTSSSATDNVWSTGETTQSIVVTASGNYDVFLDNGTCSSTTSSATDVNVIITLSSPTITADGPTTFCTGESVTLTSSSTTDNYWSTGETTQSIIVNTGGDYEVLVDNGSCSASSGILTVNVNSIPVTPSITAGGSTTFCEGGSVTLNSSSATGNIWSTGETTQSIVVTNSGSYEVLVDQGGCASNLSSPTTVTVNPLPTMPVITSSGPVAFCQGDNVELSSSYTTGNVWSTGATSQSIIVSSSGNYSVMVSNGTCTSTSPNTTITVSVQPASPSVSISGGTSFCQGDSVVLTSSSAIDNVWSTGETTQSIVVTSSGNYNVLAGSSGCYSSSATSVITVHALPNVSFVEPNMACLDWTPYVIQGGIPFGGSYSGTGLTANVFNPSAAGIGSHEITYTYTDVNSCTNTAIATLVVDDCAGLSSLESEVLYLYPNPSSGIMKFSVVQENLISIQVFDEAGRIVKFLQPNSSVNEISLSELADGLYTVIINRGESQLIQKVTIVK